MTLGAIPYAIISLAIFGMILLVMGTIMGTILQLDNDSMQDPAIPYSQERATTMNMLALCFNAMGFVALMCAGIFLIMNAVQSQSGEI
jgi:hypothetical protein